MENFYKPGRVIVTHMTPEELAEDRENLLKELRKYPWRKGKKAVIDIEEHIVDGVKKMQRGRKRVRK